MIKDNDKTMTRQVVVDAESIARYLRNGYELRLVRRKDRAASESALLVNSPISVCTDERCQTFTKIVFTGNSSCDFNCYCGSLFNEPCVSDFCKSLYSIDEFRSWCEGKLAEFRNSGLADINSTISGSLLFARGRNIHVMAALRLLEDMKTRYASVIEKAFSECCAKDYSGILEFCKSKVKYQ